MNRFKHFLSSLNQLRQITNRNRAFQIPSTSRAFSSSSTGKIKTTTGQDDEKKKVDQSSIKITLISDLDKVEITNLKEAQKKALRRNLKLVKLVDLDTKTQRAVYRLMSGSDYFALESKQRETQKAAKSSFKGESKLIFFLPKSE